MERPNEISVMLNIIHGRDGLRIADGGFIYQETAGKLLEGNVLARCTLRKYVSCRFFKLDCEGHHHGSTPFYVFL